MIPITQDWARLRGFSEACLLMPLSFISMLGGLLTLFSDDSSTTIRGVLQDAVKEDPTIQPLRAFDPGFVGLPLAVGGIAYLLVVAPRWLSRTSEARDAGTQGDEARGTTPQNRELDGSERLVTEVRLCRAPRHRSRQFVTLAEAECIIFIPTCTVGDHINHDRHAMLPIPLFPCLAASWRSRMASSQRVKPWEVYFAGWAYRWNL